MLRPAELWWLQDYDEKGDYIRTWVPELSKVPAPNLFEPWRLSREDQAKFGVQIGVRHLPFAVDLCSVIVKVSGALPAQTCNLSAVIPQELAAAEFTCRKCLSRLLQQLLMKLSSIITHLMK